MLTPIRAFALACALAAPLGAAAQQATVAFGGLKQDTSLPVEVQADTLAVNQADGTAVFTGNVLVVGGRLAVNGSLANGSGIGAFYTF